MRESRMVKQKVTRMAFRGIRKRGWTLPIHL